MIIRWIKSEPYLFDLMDRYPRNLLDFTLNLVINLNIITLPQFSNCITSVLKSFFPSLLSNNSRLKEQIDQSKHNNKSERNGKIVKNSILIQRRSPNSDIWICNSCTWIGDIWFMEKHPCIQNIRNNFAKVAQRLQQQEEFS